MMQNTQVWLDLVLLCQNMFSLPEADESEKRKLMVQVRESEVVKIKLKSLKVGKDYLPRLAVSAAVVSTSCQPNIASIF